jgi:hypothetical protein
MNAKPKPAAALPAALTGPATPGESAKATTDAKGGHHVRLFETLGGSKSESFNSVLLRETLATICVPGNDDDGMNKAIQAAAAALAAFKPRDEIEGMIAAQAVALHFGAMEALRRSMLKDQPGEIAARLRKDGANLARAMTDMLDAIDRKRGKRPQVVRVERVVVQDGGQAIVGNVNHGPKATGDGI